MNAEHDNHTPETCDYRPSQNPTKCYGYIARIINGKLVRVARVSVSGIDYNYEQ